MGGLGSGGWKKPGRRTGESCRVLDANYLSARGCLQPGGSGIRNMPLGSAKPSGIRVRCDNLAHAEAWFAKAY